MILRIRRLHDLAASGDADAACTLVRKALREGDSKKAADVAMSTTKEAFDYWLAYVCKSIFGELRFGALASAIKRGRSIARKLGAEPNPVGNGNSKVDLPSTYRPVGPTCVVTCPLLTTACYARNMRGRQSERSRADLVSSVTSVAIAMGAAASLSVPARLHVSGDFALPDEDGEASLNVDTEYIEWIAMLARAIKPYTRADCAAYTYTHFSPELFEPARLYLEASGIPVVYSEQEMVGGAILVCNEEHGKEERARLKEKGIGALLCPAQLTGKLVTCRTCTACWRLREKDSLVMFMPEKRTRRKMIAYIENRDNTTQEGDEQ